MINLSMFHCEINVKTQKTWEIFIKGKSSIKTDKNVRKKIGYFEVVSLYIKWNFSIQSLLYKVLFQFTILCSISLYGALLYHMNLISNTNYK